MKKSIFIRLVANVYGVSILEVVSLKERVSLCHSKCYITSMKWFLRMHISLRCDSERRLSWLCNINRKA